MEGGRCHLDRGPAPPGHGEAQELRLPPGRSRWPLRKMSSIRPAGLTVSVLLFLAQNSDVHCRLLHLDTSAPVGPTHPQAIPFRGSFSFLPSCSPLPVGNLHFPPFSNSPPPGHLVLSQGKKQTGLWVSHQPGADPRNGAWWEGVEGRLYTGFVDSSEGGSS